MYKYFTDKDFKNCVPSCSIDDMDKEFMELLDNIRDIAGIPFIINCAYRSKEWDLKKGRSGNSAHTKGKACDIRYTSSKEAYKIIYAAMQMGIRRIGLGKNFVHLDNDETLPQNVFFNYY